MATSEYLRTDRAASADPVTRLRLKGGRSGRVGPWSVAATAMVLLDALTILGAFGVSLVLRMGLAARLAATGMVVGRIYAWGSLTELVYAAWFALAYVLVARRYGLYTTAPAGSGFHELRMVLQGCLNAGLLLCGALYVFHGEAVSRILVLLLVLTAAVALCVRRWVWRRGRFRDFEQGIDRRNVMIVGTNQLSFAMGRHLERHRRLGCRFVGYVARPGSPVSQEIPARQILGGMDRIRALARQHFVDEVVIAEYCPTEDAIGLVEDARDLDVDVLAIAGYYGDLTTNAPVEYLGIFPVAVLHRRTLKIIGLACKRGVDIVLSLGALFATLPVLAAIALAVKIDSPGPALYVSERIGKRGRVFPCFKFRTMVQDAEKMKQQLAALNERDGILFKCSNDPRVTRIGAFLRKYSLDELPQFLNVLRGEMSLVGPRPPIASEVEKYELEHFRRLEVLPGLTGLWQVQARHDPSFAKYIELDTAYVENWSFWLDVKILLRTANVVLQGTGV